VGFLFCGGGTAGLKVMNSVSAFTTERPINSAR
jgi:hypothetical protein